MHDDALRKVAEIAAGPLDADPSQLDPAPLMAHASARQYYRVRAGRRSVVVMQLPPDALKSDEITDGRRPEELPFLTAQRYLESLGLRVPGLLREAVDQGFLVLEDLGDTTLEAALRADPDFDRARDRLYGRAVDTLAFLRHESQRRPPVGTLLMDRAFDYDLYRWELDHFREWLLEADRKVTLTPAEDEVVRSAFDGIARRLSELPRGLTHRDYQSRNLMVAGDELALIDFQDALQGPMVYDLVALLRDSYVNLPLPFVDAMVDRYLDAYRALGGQPPEREAVAEQFDLQALQRKLKDAGRFVYIDRVRGNASFLPNIPTSLGYVKQALERLPELGRLHEVLATHLPELGA